LRLWTQDFYRTRDKFLVKKVNLLSIQNAVVENAKIFFTVNFLLSVMFCFVAYFHFKDLQDAKNTTMHEKIVYDFRLALEQYLHPLQGIASAFHFSSLNINPVDFRNLALARDSFQNFKGALGFGFIRKVESHNLQKYLKSQRIRRPEFTLRRLSQSNEAQIIDEYFIVEVVEPMEKCNQGVGLVVSDESTRRETAVRAMNTGAPTLSSSIQLFQVDGSGPVGFLFLLPVYKTPKIPETLIERAENLIGWAYTPLLMNELIEFVLSQNTAQLPFQVSEIRDDGNQKILFSDGNFEKADRDVSKIFKSEISIGGRSWIVDSLVPITERFSLLAEIGIFLLLYIFGALSFYYYAVLVNRKMVFDSELLVRSEKEIARATRELSDQKNFLQSVVNEIPAVVAYWDKDLRNQLNNRASATFWGMGLRETQGMHISEVIPKDVYENDLPFMLAALEGKEQGIERVIVNATGEQRNCIVRFKPYVSNLSISGLIVTIIDISEIRELEKQNQENQALLFSKSKLSLLGEMAGGIAHEINNPLTIIKGKSKIIGRIIRESIGDDAAKQVLARHLEEVEQTTIRIATIVKGLRSFSRDADSDSFRVIGISDIVSNVLGLTSEKLKHLDIRLSTDGVKAGQNIFCNQTQIEQILMNLISNAVDAIHGLKEKWIRIDVAEKSLCWTIRVIDSGRGIDPAIVDKIMNPFFTTKGVGHGTGLGLSISKGLVEKHGGKIEYELFDMRTSFVISFPKVKPTGVAV
jgi:PAS domain S-box-containing protein